MSFTEEETGSKRKSDLSKVTQHRNYRDFYRNSWQPESAWMHLHIYAHTYVCVCLCALGQDWVSFRVGDYLLPYVKGWKSYDIFPFSQNGSLTYLPDAELDAPLYQFNLGHGRLILKCQCSQEEMHILICYLLCIHSFAFSFSKLYQQTFQCQALGEQWRWPLLSV